MEGDANIFRRMGWLAATAGAAASLSACAVVTPYEPGAGAQIDPSSPAAEMVAKAMKDPGPWPTFADIPEAPADVRSAEAWKAAVEDQKAEGLYTQRTAAADTWSLTATEAFRAQAIAEANALDIHAPTAEEIAESEAFARALRKRATPPPPPR